MRSQLLKLCSWFTHRKSCRGSRPRERVCCTKPQSLLLNIYFHPRGFQASLEIIYFRDGRNRCSHWTKVWHKTYPISDAPLRNRHGAASLNHRNRANTTVHVCEQKAYPVWFLRRRITSTTVHQKILFWQTNDRSTGFTQARKNLRSHIWKETRIDLEENYA